MATKFKYSVSNNGATPIDVINTYGAILQGTTETIAAEGTTTAVDLTKYHHDIDADAGGDIFTVAAGTVGQSILLVAKSATGTATITPATLIGGTSVTFDAAGETVELYYTAAGWVIRGGNAYTVI
jgi:hypothetical protein